MKVYGDPSAIFRKTAAELKQRPLPKSWKAVWQRPGPAARRAFSLGETLMLRERCGNSTWYLTLFPIRREGHILFAGGFGREVTPWGTAEQELRHTVLGALKAQELDRKMASQFLHDSVGQNMTALGLQLDLIRMDLETLSPETCRASWKFRRCSRA